MKYFFLLVLVLVLVLTSVLPVFAIANPDSIGIYRVTVYRDLLAADDQLWFCEYLVSYNSTPVETPGEAFSMVIYGLDGTTALFNRPLNYYGHNIISIYLTPTQALAWGGAYGVKIIGSPSYFSLVEGSNMTTKTLGAGNYKENTSLDDDMLYIAGQLQSSLGVLLTSTGLLNAAGGTYFEKAVPNLSQIIPWIFSTSITYPILPSPTGSMEYGNTVAGHAGPNLTASITDIGNWLGLSKAWVGFFLTGMSVLVVASLSYAATRRTEPGFVFGIVTIVAFVWVGIMDMRPMLILLVFVAILFGIRVLLKEFA